MLRFAYQELVRIRVHVSSRSVVSPRRRRRGRTEGKRGYLSHNIIPPGDTTVGEEWEPKPKEQSTQHIGGVEGDASRSRLVLCLLAVAI